MLSPQHCHKWTVSKDQQRTYLLHSVFITEPISITTTLSAWQRRRSVINPYTVCVVLWQHRQGQCPECCNSQTCHIFSEGEYHNFLLHAKRNGATHELNRPQVRFITLYLMNVRYSFVPLRSVLLSIWRWLEIFDKYDFSCEPLDPSLSRDHLRLLYHISARTR